MTDPLVEAAVRVYAEFADHTTLAEVLAIVARARNDLDTASAAALPELVERLARQRLADGLGSPATSYPNNVCWRRSSTPCARTVPPRLLATHGETATPLAHLFISRRPAAGQREPDTDRTDRAADRCACQQGHRHRARPNRRCARRRVRRRNPFRAAPKMAPMKRALSRKCHGLPAPCTPHRVERAGWGPQNREGASTAANPLVTAVPGGLAAAWTSRSSCIADRPGWNDRRLSPKRPSSASPTDYLRATRRTQHGGTGAASARGRDNSTGGRRA